MRDILKGLPIGAEVFYFGPSDALRRKNGKLKKVCDRSACMHVTDGKTTYRLKYYNLTCEEIIKAQQVADRLNGETVEVESVLPF